MSQVIYMFDEPDEDGGSHRVGRTREEVIEYMANITDNIVGIPRLSDEDAIHDYMVVNYAWIEEIE